MDFIYCALVLILAFALIAYGMSCKNMKSSSKEDQKKMQRIGNNFMLAGGILIVVGIPLILLFENMEKSTTAVSGPKKLGGGSNQNFDNVTLTPEEQEMFLSKFRMHPLRF